MLKHGWSQIAQRRMQPCPVIKCLYILEDTDSGLLPRFVRFMVDVLGFQRMKEALSRRVVKTATGTAHADRDAVCFQQLLKIPAGVLAAAV